MGKKAHSSYHAFILCTVITVTLRSSCLIKHVIEVKIDGRIEVAGRRGRRGKQLLDDDKEKRGDWKLIALCGELALEEATDLS